MFCCFRPTQKYSTEIFFCSENAAKDLAAETPSIRSHCLDTSTQSGKLQEYALYGGLENVNTSALQMYNYISSSSNSYVSFYRNETNGEVNKYTTIFLPGNFFVSSALIVCSNSTSVGCSMTKPNNRNFRAIIKNCFKHRKIQASKYFKNNFVPWSTVVVVVIAITVAIAKTNNQNSNFEPAKLEATTKWLYGQSIKLWLTSCNGNILWLTKYYQKSDFDLPQQRTLVFISDEITEVIVSKKLCFDLDKRNYFNK